MVFVIEFMDSINNKNNIFEKMPCTIIMLNIIIYFIGPMFIYTCALSQPFI